jgi:hypothetical protein
MIRKIYFMRLVGRRNLGVLISGTPTRAEETNDYTGLSSFLNNKTANALHRLFLSVIIRSNLRHQRFYQLSHQ